VFPQGKKSGRVPGSPGYTRFVRPLAALAVFASLGAAQSPAPSLRQPPTLSGVVLDVDTESSGEFSIRTSTDEVIRYRFDPATAVSREQRAVQAASLLSGDRVEVESSPLPDSHLRLARAVMVVEAAQPNHFPRNRPEPYHADSYVSEGDRLLLNRGNLLLSGVVSRFFDGALILHTREKGEQTFRVRSDTRFLAGGARARAADLKPDTRVFIRAGRDVFGATEVYEVAWGQILEPR
jgi:hypothetical protein